MQGMQKNLLSPPQVSSQRNRAGQQQDRVEWEVGRSQLAEGLQDKPYLLTPFLPPQLRRPGSWQGPVRREG